MEEDIKASGNVTITGAGGFYVNLSPDAFHQHARHYYKCKQDFVCPDKFSPLPYFLLCRAIELELKSIHLISQRQNQVKATFGHNLSKVYRSLDSEWQILSKEEITVLDEASEIYREKGFEYFVSADALRAYKNYPDLEMLDSIAQKFIKTNPSTL